MVEFLRKSESCGIIIDPVNTIRITKLPIYFNFLRAVPLGDVIKMTRFLMSWPVNQYTTSWTHNTDLSPTHLFKFALTY